MSRSRPGAAYWALSLLVVALGLISLLPLIESNAWWVRLVDFARLHLLIALVIGLAALLFVARSRRTASWPVLLIGLCGLAYDGYKLVPYLGWREPMAIPVAECPDGSRLRVLTANVHNSLEKADELFRIVDQADPDLFLVVETDEWWDDRLSTLAPRFTAQVQQVTGTRAAFGMHLFSKYPIESSEITFPLDNRVPAVRAQVRLPDGSTATFHGLHPRPPTFFQSSEMRDAQLLIAGLDAAEAAGPVVLAGDLNAVPWERTFRRMMRLGGLLDPRVGRGYFATYDARTPVLYWPIDHVLFSDELGLLGFQRLEAFDSDHWPVLADLCHRPELSERQSPPAVEDGDAEEAETSIRTALGQS